MSELPSISHDISSVDLGEQVTQFQEENEKLLQHKQILENDIMKLCTDLTQMKAAKDNLQMNISELFNATKEEVKRKDRMIAELQRQLDDLMLKRKTKQPYNREHKEFKNENVAHKRSRDEATSESDTNKRVKYKTGGNNVCNVVKTASKAEVWLSHPKEICHKFASKHFSRSHSRSSVRKEESRNRRERGAKHSYPSNKIAANPIITLENRFMNANGTNKIRAEIATTSNTNKVEEIQSNAVNNNKDDNSVNQNVVVSNGVSNGPIVNNSQITLNTQLLGEPIGTVITEKSLNVIQSCNISHRICKRKKKRPRCIINVINS